MHIPEKDYKDEDYTIDAARSFRRAGQKIWDAISKAITEENAARKWNEGCDWVDVVTAKRRLE